MVYVINTMTIVTTTILINRGLNRMSTHCLVDPSIRFTVGGHRWCRSGEHAVSGNAHQMIRTDKIDAQICRWFCFLWCLTMPYKGADIRGYYRLESPATDSRPSDLIALVLPVFSLPHTLTNSQIAGVAVCVPTTWACPRWFGAPELSRRSWVSLGFRISPSAGFPNSEGIEIEVWNICVGWRVGKLGNNRDNRAQRGLRL